MIRRQQRRGRWDEQYPAIQDSRRVKVLGLLSACRRGQLGARQYRCGQCDNQRVTLNSCSDRHCPDCARQSRYLWHRDVLNWSLNCDYLHIVVTLPHELNDLIAANRGELLRLLFRCVQEVLLELAAQRYGCTPGLIAVLHTWGKKLNRHFHLHTVMTAGGLSKDGQSWIHIDQEQMQAANEEIARRFKTKYLRGVRKALRKAKLVMPESLPDDQAVQEMLRIIEGKDWITHVGATQQSQRDAGQQRMSLSYVGRYVAGTAIGDGRIMSMEDDRVTFAAFDYRTRQTDELAMSDSQFVTAFSDHILPLRLRRFRMSGIFAPQGRGPRLAKCRKLLGAPTQQQLDEASDETQAGDAFDGEDMEDEGSYVPCPKCEKKMQMQLAFDGSVIVPLLAITAAATGLLQRGTAQTIQQAIAIVAAAGQKHSVVHRTLLPGRFETHSDLISTVEILIADRLSQQEAEASSRGHPRGPPEAPR